MVEKSPNSAKTYFKISAGDCKIRNAKKKQSILIENLVQLFGEKLVACSAAGTDGETKSIRAFSIETNGFNSNREGLLTQLFDFSLRKRVQITRFSDTTKLPHNGCRRPKQRRL
jgi:ribosomal protein S11